MTLAAAISNVATWLPETIRTTADTEAHLHACNPGMSLPTGLIARLTGVERVHVADHDVMASDLAVNAVNQLLGDTPDALDGIDLLIFASATQDLIEPATSHIVAAKLGLTCPVFDVKNACNSVLNALEIANALVRQGTYERVLVCSGEKPSIATRWELDAPGDFVRAFPGYTMGDGGAALLIERVDEADGPAILGSGMIARSEHWQVGTVAAGGTVDPAATHGRWFDMDGGALFAAFQSIPAQPWSELKERSGTSVERSSFVAVHQVAKPYLKSVCETIGVCPEQLIVTVDTHGNLASVTLPRQLELARAQGRISPGSETLLVGLAGGISVGMMGVRW